MIEKSLSKLNKSLNYAIEMINEFIKIWKKYIKEVL